METQMEEEERREVKAFMERFFEAYYTERDHQRVSDMVIDDVTCVGLGPDEIGYDKPTFERFMKLQMAGAPRPSSIS